MEQRVTQKQEIARIEALGGEPCECPTCGQLGFANTSDERGLLVVHPGRSRPCRVRGAES